ncbi:MAG: caspase family protein [Myxococcales bacterium]
MTVRYEPTGSVERDLYVAVVAAGAYQGFASLPLTQKDAATVKSAFLRQQGKGYRSVHVKSWCDSTCGPGASKGCIPCDALPTAAELRQGVPEFFSAMKDGDYAVLYVSGHGLKWDQRYYFVPGDARPGDVSTLLEWSELRDFLTRAPVIGRRLVLLDTCHAGAVGGQAREQDRLVQQSAELDGVYILSASAANQSAFELADLGNGLFTYVLKHALGGDADSRPEDARVSFEELGWYLSENVRALSSARGIRQEPHVPILGADLDYVVAAVPASRARVKLDVVERRPGELERINPAERVQAWETDLTEGIEGLRLAAGVADMTHKLTLWEVGSDRLDLSLEARDGKSLLQKRGFAKAEVIRLLRQVLEGAR